MIKREEVVALATIPFLLINGARFGLINGTCGRNVVMRHRAPTARMSVTLRKRSGGLPHAPQCSTR